MSQAQGIYSQCGLTFSPGREDQKGRLGAETTWHLLYCSRARDNGRPSRDLPVPPLRPNSVGSCRPQAQGRLRLSRGGGWAPR